MQIFKGNMEVEELKELLKGREKRTLEYKRAWNEVPKNMFDTVCAFLNRDGGVIVLGVEDNGQIKKGVDPEAVHQMCKDISNLSNNPQKLSPTFLLQPEEVDVDGKKVIVVFVPSSSQVHKSAGNIYDRSTDGDYILKTDAEISALYLRKRQTYSENHVFPYLRLEHLDENTIAKARQLIKRKFPNHPWLEMDTMEMMRQANLYCYDLETNKSGFNLAALMLFGKQEFIQSALPYYRLDAVVRLDNVDRYDDRLPLMGNIIDSYDALMAFVEKHLPDPFFLEGDQRTSLREKIFREIISNVLVHREYMNPTYTVFEINREGIIVSNANKPLKAGPVTLRNYVRHPKNPHMANFFMQMGRAEHLGTGIRNLYHYVPIYTGADPVIMDDDMYTVKMNLPKSMQMLKAVGEDTAQDTAQVTVQDTAQVSNQVKMLIVTLGEETLSRDELMARLHLEHRENFRSTYLKPAIDDEFVNLTIPDKPTSGKQKYFLSKKGLQKLRELRVENGK